jgi:hypothetical protein
MSRPTGESTEAPVGGGFDRRLKLEVDGNKIASDAALLAFRALAEGIAGADQCDLRQSRASRSRRTTRVVDGLRPSGSLISTECNLPTPRPLKNPPTPKRQRIGRFQPPTAHLIWIKDAHSGLRHDRLEASVGGTTLNLLRINGDKGSVRGKVDREGWHGPSSSGSSPRCDSRGEVLA